MLPICLAQAITYRELLLQLKIEHWGEEVFRPGAVQRSEIPDMLNFRNTVSIAFC